MYSFAILNRVPLRVQIVTAEREVFAQDDVDMVVAPGSEGVVGILPRHAPLLTTLQPGVIRIKRGDSEDAMSVSGGFLQIAHLYATSQRCPIRPPHISRSSARCRLRARQPRPDRAQFDC